ncbi:MAG: ATP-binding protein [Succinivibrio sp.]|jgi:predicted AAA+ superfamily ATPase|nr:ATP-binding protein [Succinivibrio sp.]
MLTRTVDRILIDHFKISKTALLIEGARQIGKTFSIRQFGKKFKTYIEINFIEQPEAISLFKDLSNTKDLLARLSLFTKQKLIKRDTLIFFDEVQICPEVITYIKFLVDEGSYNYILSGSLLGIEINDLRSVPVGYLTIKRMFPLTFREFALNLGLNSSILENLETSFKEKKPVDDFIHKKMMELFRVYLVVGGMPAAVNRYIETNNLNEVIDIQNQIVNLYKKDITQYDKNNKLAIAQIFELIAPQLNSQNKRFIIKDIKSGVKFDRYENSFLWLKDAGFALPVYNVETPKIPLKLSKSRSLFKLFMSDVGLLASEYSQGIQLKIISGDDKLNYGAIFENYIAQELTACEHDLYYYNNKKRGELDFLIEYDGEVLPIEVKSGKDYKVHRALSNIMDCGEFNLNRALIFNNSNLKVEGKLTYAPIYMAMFLKQEIKDEDSIYKIDLSELNKRF